MKKYIDQANIWLSERTPRERLMVLLITLAFIYALWNVLFDSPLSVEIDNKSQQITTTKDQINSLAEQKKAILVKIGEFSKQSQKYQALENQLKNLNDQIMRFSGGFIPPEAMDQVINKISEMPEGLTLVSLKNYPDEVLTEIPSVMKNAATRGKIYEHKIQIKIKGNYFDILQYIKNLEKLSWRLFWDNLDYEVINYPTGIVTINIHTLSQQESLINA